MSFFFKTKKKNTNFAIELLQPLEILVGLIQSNVLRE
jgi:hypothetical protein